MPDNQFAVSSAASSRSLLLLAYTGLVLATLAWAGNAVIGRGLRQAYDPLELAFYRWSLACLCLYIINPRAIHADLEHVRCNVRRLLMGGICGMAGYHVLQYFALSRMPAGDVAVIVGMTPVTVTLAQAVSRRAWPKPLVTLGVCLGMCGVLLVCHRTGSAASRENVSWTGIGAATTSMLCWSFYSVRSNRCEPISWLGTTFFMALASTLILLPFYAYDVIMSGWSMPNIMVGVQLLYLGVPASVLAYALYNFGIERVGAVRAAQFNCLIPAFASGFAALFLNESMTKMQALGLILTIVALNLVLVAKASDERP